MADEFTFLRATTYGWTTEPNERGDFELLDFGEQVSVTMMWADFFSQEYNQWEWLLRMMERKIEQAAEAEKIERLAPILWEMVTVEWEDEEEIDYFA